jgi:hypothetical protein
VSWIRDVLPGVDVLMEPLSADGRGHRGVNLYLWQLRPRPPVGSHRHDILRIGLQYLVATWAPDPIEAHEMLLGLAYRAMQEPGLDVDLEPVDPSVFAAFGVPPTPTFRLTVPSERALETTRARPVLHPLGITATALASLSGWVRTPDGIPIAGARVDVPAIDRRARTDADGRFRLDAIPAAETSLRVRVTAKGQEAWATVGAADDPAGVVIELDPREVRDAGVSHP